MAGLGAAGGARPAAARHGHAPADLPPRSKTSAPPPSQDLLPAPGPTFRRCTGRIPLPPIATAPRLRRTCPVGHQQHPLPKPSPVAGGGPRKARGSHVARPDLAVSLRLPRHHPKTARCPPQPVVGPSRPRGAVTVALFGWQWPFWGAAAGRGFWGAGVGGMGQEAPKGSGAGAAAPQRCPKTAPHPHMPQRVSLGKGGDLGTPRGWGNPGVMEMGGGWWG